MVSVKRACKKLRDEGAAGFFRSPGPRQGHKLTEQRLQEIQNRLDVGMEVPAIGVELGVLPNTIHKAIRAERLKKKRKHPPAPTEKKAHSNSPNAAPG